MQTSFELKSEFIALCNLLKLCGVADSGGQAKHMVADGMVQVDGQTELRKTCKIRPGQQVLVAGMTISVVAAHG